MGIDDIVTTYVATPSPSALPTALPTPLPIPAPSRIPIPSPSAVPIPAPSLSPTATGAVPTPLPTPLPTLTPTTGLLARHFEDFEGGTKDAWGYIVTGTESWSVNSGSTPTTGTGPSGANGGSYYAFVEATYSGSESAYASDGSVTYDWTMYSLFGTSHSATAVTQISFYYHMYTTQYAILTLKLICGSTGTTLWSQSGNQGSSWQQVVAAVPTADQSCTSYYFKYTADYWVPPYLPACLS